MAVCRLATALATAEHAHGTIKTMLIVANWKAYVEDLGRAKELVGAARRLARGGREIVLAPPAPFLGALATGKGKVAFAAQDVSATLGGAETGEATARMFSSTGATYAIVGHSERRAAGDTNASVAEKLGHAFAHALTPILCVGERERDNEGHYLATLREEVISSVSAIESKHRSSIIVAYEPLWAIGKGAEDAIRPDDLAEMLLYLRKVLAELLPGKSSARAQVLYGGSVSPENIASLAAVQGVDGFLIGRASTEADTFTGLIKAIT